MDAEPDRPERVRSRPHWMTAVVVVLALAGSLVAAGAARQVRDANERRLLEQRADGIAQIIAGLGSSFEADLAAAAAYAHLGTTDDFARYVTSSRGDLTENVTWALVEREGDGFRPTTVVPDGASTYFDGVALPDIDGQLLRAFAGEFVVTGVFGAGVGRRMGIAVGVPESGTGRIVYLEFPLLAVAASSPDVTEPALFDQIELALYVGTEPSDDGLIFGTFEGPPPPDAVTVDFAAGGQDVIVVVHATSPLSGRLAHDLPLIILVFGLSIGALAALLIEVSLRKQRAALALAEELRAKHAALEVAVSEQARAEAGLLEAQRNEAVGELARGIAHDFNNLLSVVSGYAELAGDRSREPGVQADLAEIVNAANRGAALTRRLLRFANVDACEPEVCDVNAVVRDIAGLLERTVGEDIALVIDLAARPSTVPISVSELEQIVVNLVVNARRAIPAAGLISVRTRTDSESETVVLEVGDDGIGMSADVATRAFEPMFSTRDRSEGSGLGLATVASIVRRAGGVAGIDSSPGKGTTVRIVLPVATGIGDDLDRDIGAFDSADVSTGGHLTVLLVEDDESVRRAMRRMLEDRGYRVHEAISGLDAVERFLDTCVPDIIVTDVVMPGGYTGGDVADRFRTRLPDLPVVFVSGYATDMLGDHVLSGGAVRILAKPFSAADLASAVASALAERVRP